MKTMHALAVCTMALAMMASAWSRADETTRIHGVVVDALTGQPVPGATVTGGQNVLQADAQGAFSADGAEGPFRARAPGYLRAQDGVTADGDQAVLIELTPFRPRAVYLSVYGVTSTVLRGAAVKLQQTNGINALVIDVKGDRGLTPYRSAVRDSADATRYASAAPKVADFPQLLSTLHREGFYLIARIVTFKDDPLASAHPEWAVRDASGAPWRDREKLQWVDPFSRDVWEHNLALAEEVARLGFDEIQFDYVRFPDASGLRFMLPNTAENRVEAISGFLQEARARLAPYNVFISADIFGYVCWNRNDTAIGQQLERLGASLDYISPMLYPSGFSWGIPGLANPVAEPGEIVSRSLAQARARSGLPGVRFRPWLQAFRDYAFDRRDFGEKEIRLQVGAADEQDSDGWMLWNPHNRYDPAQLPK